MALIVRVVALFWVCNFQLGMLNHEPPALIGFGFVVVIVIVDDHQRDHPSWYSGTSFACYVFFVVSSKPQPNTQQEFGGRFICVRSVMGS